MPAVAHTQLFRMDHCRGSNIHTDALAFKILAAMHVIMQEGKTLQHRYKKIT
jgi:hypothetical protein